MEHSLGKDIYCLSGDTIVVTEDGPRHIKDIEGEYVRLYSSDDNGNLCLSYPSLVVLTKETSELYEIELEDGTKIKCTGEHLLRLKDGSYKRVDSLTEDDEIMEIQMTY